MDEPLVVDQDAAVRPRRHLSLLLAAVAAAVVVLDVATKHWAVARLTDRAPIHVIDGLLQLHLTRNPGAAFSFATGSTWLFTVVAAGVSVYIVRVSRRLGTRWWAVALGLLLGGAIGNLLDRLFREPGFARGHVIDFIELPHYPIFNVADSCIVTSAVLIGLLGLRGIGVDGRRSSG